MIDRTEWKAAVVLGMATVGLWRLPAVAAPAASGETRAAVEKAIPLIQKGAAGHAAQRTCFSCHHQALPVLALTTARDHGFSIDAEVLKKQVAFTEASMRGARESYRKGQGQGGQVDTASYGLLTLELGGWKPDETTAAVSEYLLQRDAATGHWRVTSNRPPSESSSITASCLALRALRTFGAPDQQSRIEERARKTREWLLEQAPTDTEDLVFRLWGLSYAGATAAQLAEAAKPLRAAQRPDGGWGQTPAMAPDAYATGSALLALHRAGGLSVSDPAYRSGANFLLGSQLPDGSWHVVSRSKPFQPYYESGFPHGKDQFISMSATCWAVAALAESQ